MYCKCKNARLRPGIIAPCWYDLLDHVPIAVDGSEGDGLPIVHQEALDGQREDMMLPLDLDLDHVG